MPVRTALRRHPQSLSWLGFESWNKEILGHLGSCRSWEASGRRHASVCACSSRRSLALVSFPNRLAASHFSLSVFRKYNLTSEPV